MGRLLVPQCLGEAKVQWGVWHRAVSICNGSTEGLAILVGMGKEKQQGLDHRHVMHRASDMGGGLVTCGGSWGRVN